MNDELSRARAGYVAAFLAVLVLGAFWCMRYYGPESTVRRFHRAVQIGDMNEMARTSWQPVDSSTSEAVQAYASTELRESQSYAVVGARRSPKEVVVVVQYNHTDGTVTTMNWVVSYQRNTWRIDTLGTWGFIQNRIMGLSMN